MKVKQFELHPNSDTYTYQLIINDKLISKRISNLYVNGNFAQIEVCEQCCEPGCSDSGYVEILEIDDIIIWKEPFQSKAYDYYCDYIDPQGLKYGPIFWTKEKYNQFIYELNKDSSNSRVEVFQKGIPIDTAYDLWRINGSHSYRPNYEHVFSIDNLIEESIGLYSENLSQRECEDIFIRSSTNLANAKEIRLLHQQVGWSKIVMMFDSPTYREWECLYLNGSNVLYPIGDQYVISIS